VLGQKISEGAMCSAIRQSPHGLVANRAIALVNARRRLVLVDIDLCVRQRRGQNHQQASCEGDRSDHPDLLNLLYRAAINTPKPAAGEWGERPRAGCYSRIAGQAGFCFNHGNKKDPAGAAARLERPGSGRKAQ
jgi:hypothetical protein